MKNIIFPVLVTYPQNCRMLKIKYKVNLLMVRLQREFVSFHTILVFHTWSSRAVKGLIFRDPLIMVLPNTWRL